MGPEPTAGQDELALAQRDMERYGLVPPGEHVELEALVGGISSAVFRAHIGDRCVVLKRALPQLRVEAEWLADVGRSKTEARFATLMSGLLPRNVPRPIHVDVEGHAFVMECAPEGSETWKTQLMRRELSESTSEQVGSLLGQMHQLTVDRPDIADEFASRDTFEELRIDPYLRSTAMHNPDLAAELTELDDELLERGDCLVHGDFSPKNLLVSPQGTVMLVDHEVAHWGDPAFDLAFVLSHLSLKAIHMPAVSDDLVALARSLVAAYAARAGTVGEGACERTPRLLAALLLARVDGKSKVEYLDGRGMDQARQLARALLSEPAPDIDAVFSATIEAAR